MTRSIASKLAQKKLASVSRETTQAQRTFSTTGTAPILAGTQTVDASSVRKVRENAKKRSHITIQSGAVDNDGGSQTLQNTSEMMALTKCNDGSDSITKTHDNDMSASTTRSESKKIRWEPTSWRQQLQNIKQMRRERDAPVDVMGCDKLSDANASPEVYIIISIGPTHYCFLKQNTHIV